MKKAVFTTSRGTEVELRNVVTPLTLDILQAAINLADKAEIALSEMEEVDRSCGIMLHTPVLAGGSLILYITPVQELDQESIEADEADEADESLSEVAEAVKEADTPVFTSQTQEKEPEVVYGQESDQAVVNQEEVQRNIPVYIDIDNIIADLKNYNNPNTYIANVASEVAEANLPGETEDVKNEFAALLEEMILEVADQLAQGLITLSI